MVEYYEGLVDAFPIVLIEDGMAEDDWAGWKRLNLALGNTIELVGDNFATPSQPLHWITPVLRKR